MFVIRRNIFETNSSSIHSSESKIGGKQDDR